MIKDFFSLKKNLKKDYTKFSSVKVALLGDSATQLLVTALKGQSYDNQLNLDVFEADYDQIPLQINNTTSELHEFQADYVIIFQSTQKLLQQFNNLDSENRLCWAQDKIDEFEHYFDTIKEHTTQSKIIVFNLPFIDNTVFGNYSNKVEYSFNFQLRKLNYLLSASSLVLNDFHICDVSAIQSNLGTKSFLDTSMYYNNSMIFSFDALPFVAKNTLDIISAGEGRFRKCLILDLDNTMWGGVIGDDGVDKIQIGGLGIGKAFSELQCWAKELKNRGIILCVCSKNTESIAKEPFERHPDMILKLEDFAVFVANWENKVDNIRHIQSILNIGFDSMVFLDDNPFERGIVKKNLPTVVVPDLPEDPAEYLNFIRGLNLFETFSFSGEDKERTKKYQVEAQRVKSQQRHTDEQSFLRSLEMKCSVSNFNSFNAPRVAQLTQRSNQFNLRTIRYTEEDIMKIQVSIDHIGLAFSLEDKFGSYGLIAVVILEKKSEKELFINTWLMSCRILKRGVERFILSVILEQAKKNEIKRISGEYIPSAKNELVRNHYRDLGFVNVADNNWEISANKKIDNTNLIQKK